MTLADLLSVAPRVTVETEDGTRPLVPSAETPGVWGDRSDVLVRTEPTADGGTTVMLDAHATPVRRVRLRWGLPIPDGLRLLGDHWERGYGDLEWRGVVPERVLPWYFLAQDAENGATHGVGVMTGGAAGAWASWRVDGAAVHLDLDVSCGGRGVVLGGRPLTCAVVRTRRGEPGETPMEAARALCRLLCPTPRLSAAPVYGGNDWYYAYGRSTAEGILRDTERIVRLSPGGENRPFSVIDDGWQANRRAATFAVGQCGPWDRGNADFPDMPGLAARMRDAGARPGIWIRPLGAPPGTPENRLLPPSRVLGDANIGVPALDPSLSENLAQITADLRRLSGWGYELIKHDWTTCDVLGRWGFDMLGGKLTHDDWAFADRSRTTAEIIGDLYRAIREGAGDALLIGCNTIGHLGAGLFEIQRTGDDTSGREWDRTRKMGVNTLAFRMAQHDTFFAADADCVGLTRDIPWHLNRQWLDLLARSGTPLFVSADPGAVGPEQEAALKEAFALASVPRPPAEPLDWLDTVCPRRWRFGDGETASYDWYDGATDRTMGT